jgi:hypothetical protein
MPGGGVEPLEQQAQGARPHEASMLRLGLAIKFAEGCKPGWEQPWGGGGGLYLGMSQGGFVS